MSTGSPPMFKPLRLIFFGLLLCPTYSLSPQNLWSAYKVSLSQRPLFTKSATAAVIGGISDALAQRAASTRGDPERTRRHSWMRTRDVLLAGFFYSGPAAHAKFAWQERLVRDNGPSSLVARLFLHTLLDMLVFAPIVLAGYLTVRTVLEEHMDPKNLARAISTKLSAKWKRTVFAAWRVWPPVNLFNYSLVPLEYRVLCNNLVALVWTGYLTFINSLQNEDQNERAGKTGRREIVSAHRRLVIDAFGHEKNETGG